MITSTATHASHSELQGHLLMRERLIGLMLLRVLQLLWCREKRKLRHFHKTIRYASRQVGMPITCRVAPPTFPFAQTRVHIHITCRKLSLHAVYIHNTSQVRATKRVRVKGRFAKGPVPAASPGGGPAESMATNDHDEAGHAGKNEGLSGAAGCDAAALAGTSRPAASTLAQVCIAGPSEEMTEVGRRASQGGREGVVFSMVPLHMQSFQCTEQEVESKLASQHLMMLTLCTTSMCADGGACGWAA
jgi:hypothetical protein